MGNGKCILIDAHRCYRQVCQIPKQSRIAYRSDFAMIYDVELFFI